jgi:cytochrome P450
MPEVLDIAALPSLNEVGFTAGRDSFRAFCRKMFRAPEPRFLKDEKGQLVVFRNADLRAFGAAPEVGNVPIGKLYPNKYGSAGEQEKKLPGRKIREVIGNQVFTFNPPLHGPARKILTSWLGPKQVSLLEGSARKIAKTIIEDAADGTEIDFVRDLAERLVIEFWGELLNLTEDETRSLGRCAQDMTRLFHVDRSLEDLATLDQAFSRYARILNNAAERGLAAGDPTLMEIAARLADLTFDDDPSEAGIAPKTVGGFLAGNLVDGVHTAALAAANTFFTLLNNPQALETIRQAPTLIPRAIAEALRLEPPILLLSRYILQDFHYGDIIIPAGTMVTMLWAAGNHDPAAFPAPETYDLNRLQIGMTTFGGGIHICPGRYVGVMLVKVLMEEFDASSLSFEAGTAASAWYQAHNMGQLKAMPVKLRKGAR